MVVRKFARADSILENAIEDGSVVGLAAAATSKDGLIYEGYFGNCGSTNPAVNESTIFWIASMTKALTSLAALQLVDENRIQLDAPVGNVAPELAMPMILEGFDADGSPKLRNARNPITLRHLLAHVSGLAEDIWSPDIKRFISQQNIPPGSTKTLASLHLPLLFEPGSSWHYGIGHDWAGLIIERIVGKPLDAAMRERIFEPLGMQDTAWDLDAEQQSRLAQVHRREADGTLSPFNRPVPSQREFIPGGGSLHATMADYLRFMRMVLNGGELDGVRVIGEASLNELFTNSSGNVRVGRLVSTNPEMSNCISFMDGHRCCWGLGLQVNLEPLRQGRDKGAMGWGGLGNTYFWIDPRNGIGGIMMTQVLPFADRRVLELFSAFERAIYDKVMA